MKKWIAGATFAALLVMTTAPALAVEQRQNSQAKMLGDLVVARPLGALLTVVGAVAFVVSLPLTAVTSTVDEAAQILVIGPARETFVRCLGCVNAGRPLEHEEPR